MTSLTHARIRAASGKEFSRLRETGNIKMNTKNIRQIIHGCLALGLATLPSIGVQAQTTVYNWDNTEPGGGNWTVESNWDSLLAPSAFFDESANIGNGGTAFVDGSASSAAGITIPSGTLEIRSGGTLASTPGGTVGNGAVEVGGGTGEAHLRILGGGSFTAPILTVDAGSADTSVELGGTGSLIVSGNAALGRTTRITGNAATFSVGGDLNIGGNFINEITDPTTHSAINVVGGVAIDSDTILNLEFGGGVTPSSGDSWPLVSGSTGITGSFNSIVGPAVGDGLGYKVNTAGGNLSVSVGSILSLKVNRTTGAATIEGGAGPVDMELYAIGSTGGHLTPGSWLSLDAAGFDGDSWVDGDPPGNPNGLAEARANPLGSSTIAADHSQGIGSVFNTSGLTFAEDREDLTFSYIEPGNTSFTHGIVDYEGGHNNLVLVVDPETGDAAIQNQSAFDATINLYAISSDSGSLLPDMSETVGVDWDSFQETGVDGGVWQRGPGSAEVLVEANPALATTISSGGVFNIGTPWDMSDRDLTFRFLLDGDSIFTQGVVEYGDLITTAIPGDYDDNGEVAVGDLNLVLFNWNQDGADLPADWVNERPSAGSAVAVDQLNGVLFNWGNTASIVTVPEPASVVLVSLSLFAACFSGRKHPR